MPTFNTNQYTLYQSIYISYKASCTTGAAAASGLIYGIPVYSPILQVDTVINGQTIESVNQYNEVCQMFVNCNMDV